MRIPENWHQLLTFYNEVVALRPPDSILAVASAEALVRWDKGRGRKEWVTCSELEPTDG